VPAVAKQGVDEMPEPGVASGTGNEDVGGNRARQGASPVRTLHVRLPAVNVGG
jgi:hypothetical protein